MFDMKRPCNNCPFRRGVGQNFQMAPQRLVEITTQMAFQCHKTIDYAQWDDPRLRQGETPQQCAGLMALLRDEEIPNAIMGFAINYGALDLDALDPEGEAYSTLDEVFVAHTGHPKPEDFRARASLVLAMADEDEN